MSSWLLTLGTLAHFPVSLISSLTDLFIHLEAGVPEARPALNSAVLPASVPWCRDKIICSSLTPLNKLVYSLQNPQLFTLTFFFSLFLAHFSLPFIRETYDIFCCLLEAHLTFKSRHGLRENGWKTSSQQRGPRNKQGHYPICGKVDSKPRLVRRGKKDILL